MNEDDLKAKLISEGFENIFVHTDSPGAYYPDHTHSMETCHIVLEGEITVMASGVTRIYRVGERFDVAAGEVHSAKVGENGCMYIIGERKL